MKTLLADMRAKWRTMAFTWALGIIGALLFKSLSLPLPWVIGPVFFITITAFMGKEVWTPKPFREPSIFVLGALFGASVKPEFLDHVVSWLPSMMVVVIYVMMTTACVALYNMRVGKYDYVTATLGAAPGGLIPMTLLCQHYGGKDQAVALMQGGRLIWTVLAIPIAFRLLAGYEPSGNAGTGGTFSEFELAEAPIYLVACAVGYFLARLARLPTPALMGPMIIMGILTVMDYVHSEIPDPLVAIAQLMIGMSIAVRFNGYNFKKVAFDIKHATITSFAMILAACAFALATSQFTDIPIRALILGYAPGGFAEMALIAFGLGIDVSFVVSHQLMRYVFIVLSSGPVMAWLARGK